MKLNDLIKKGNQSNEAPAKVETGPVDSQESPNPPAQAPVKKMGFGLKPAASTPASKPPTIGLKLGGAVKKLATPTPKPAATAEIEGLDLSSLASLDVSDIESTPARPAIQFPDEIEATAPVRELPADMTGQQVAFIESLDVIYTVLHDPDMLGQSIRMIMQELQENQEFIQLVSDHDVHTMIKAIRNVMGVAKIRKEEKSTKRTTGTRSKRTAASKFDADTLSQLDDMMANSKAFDDD